MSQDWQSEELPDVLINNLEEVKLDISPKKIYKNEVKDVLKSYQDILKRNGFVAELTEPEGENGGRVSGEVKARLTVNTFKIPSSSDRRSSELEIKISAKDEEVTVEGVFPDGDRIELQGSNTKALNSFDQGFVETAIRSFNKMLVDKAR